MITADTVYQLQIDAVGYLCQRKSRVCRLRTRARRDEKRRMSTFCQVSDQKSDSGLLRTFQHLCILIWLESSERVCILTVRPPHGVVQVRGQPLPQRAVLRVARVHPPQAVVVAPVAAVPEEVGLVVVQPHEGGVHALRGQAEVADWPRVPLLHDVVFKHPVLLT